MSILEKQLINTINKNEQELSYFILRNLRKKIGTKKIRQELITLLPTIMSHTNNHNSSWLNNNKDTFSFFKETNFLNNFIENIDKFQLNGCPDLLIKSFHNIFSLFTLTETQTKQLITKLLACNCELDQTLMEQLYFMVQKNYPELITNLLNQYIVSNNSCNACLHLIYKNEKYLYLIEKNIDIILENNLVIDLFELKNMMTEYPEVINKIKVKIEENKFTSIYHTIKKIYNQFLEKNNINLTALSDKANKNLETILEVIYLIIEDICQNEHVKISDMKILSSGGYSSALEVGDKIIKIGKTRGTKTFPNNPYINAILLRKEFPITFGISFFIEVNEKVDTASKIEEEELYQLYKKLRDIHLIWVDVGYRNVGRLLKDNLINWRDNLPLTDERLGLQKFRGNEVLKKGEIVILDNDLIYEETNPKAKSLNTPPLQIKFEKRYQEEKRKKNSSQTTELNKQVIEKSEKISSKKR